MIEIYRRKCQMLNEAEIGQTHLVLVEGTVQKTGQVLGRNELYMKVVFDQEEILTEDGGSRLVMPGDYVAVKITGAKSSVLSGTALCHSSIKEFYREVSWGQRSALRS
jgi:tRNA A37 methylthiotransferase MiaB